jgi:hypothetical protein
LQNAPASSQRLRQSITIGLKLPPKPYDSLAHVNWPGHCVSSLVRAHNRGRTRQDIMRHGLDHLSHLFRLNRPIKSITTPAMPISQPNATPREGLLDGSMLRENSSTRLACRTISHPPPTSSHPIRRGIFGFLAASSRGRCSSSAACAWLARSLQAASFFGSGLIRSIWQLGQVVVANKTCAPQVGHCSSIRFRMPLRKNFSHAGPRDVNRAAELKPLPCVGYKRFVGPPRPSQRFDLHWNCIISIDLPVLVDTSVNRSICSSGDWSRTLRLRSWLGDS